MAGKDFAFLFIMEIKNCQFKSWQFFLLVIYCAALRSSRARSKKHRLRKNDTAAKLRFLIRSVMCVQARPLHSLHSEIMYCSPEQVRDAAQFILD